MYNFNKIFKIKKNKINFLILLFIFNLKTENNNLEINSAIELSENSETKNNINKNKFNTLENFENQLKLFKPNACWIMQELLNLQIKDFFKGFEQVILTLAQSITRAEYFNEKNIIDSSELYQKSLWQCIVFEIFLTNIYLKTNTKDLDIFLVTKKVASNIGLTPILEIAQQLDIQEGTHHPLFVFYAFYCDCLVNQFSEIIKIAYGHIDDPEKFKKYQELAVKFNKQIKEKISKLKNWSNSVYDKTKFEAVYADLYEKNQQIISLLKKTRKE